MKRSRVLGTVFVLCLLITAVLFAEFAYSTFSIPLEVGTGDAIVVLAGGRGRVEEGVRLFREQKGGWLLFIGVDPKVRKADLFRDGQGSTNDDRVVLEKTSRNTLENALYARSIIERLQIRSITLITSRYHMKRATLMFRNILPPEIVIHAHPVDSKNLQEKWWRHGSSIRLLCNEFYKYYLFRFLFRVAPGELRPLAEMDDDR